MNAKRLRTRLLRALPPAVGYRVMAARRLLAPTARHRQERRLRRICGDPHRVLAGPFAGMRYLKSAYAGAALPKTLGLYEMELAESVERLCGLNPDVVVDVGAAEGYYAVGMAFRIPEARVVAFDTAPIAHQFVKRLARLNGVADRVELHGLCDTRTLERLLSAAERPVLISDCEGFEDELLDPEQAPSLRTTVILVELHDMLRPGLSDRVSERFASTHQIRRIPQRERRMEDLPASVTISSEDARPILEQRRAGESEWFEMTPRPVAAG